MQQSTISVFGSDRCLLKTHREETPIRRRTISRSGTARAVALAVLPFRRLPDPFSERDRACAATTDPGTAGTRVFEDVDGEGNLNVFREAGEANAASSQRLLLDAHALNTQPNPLLGVPVRSGDIKLEIRAAPLLRHTARERQAAKPCDED